MGWRSYPTDERGLAIHPAELNLPIESVDTNVHHLYWPHKQYLGNLITSTFVELPCNKVSMDKQAHFIGIHQYFDPPAMPEPTVMMDVILEEYDLGRIHMSRRQINDIKRNYRRDNLTYKPFIGLQL